MNNYSQTPTNGYVRYSTGDDIKEIIKWIKLQSKRKIYDTFVTNIGATVYEHKNGNLLVFIDNKTGLAVAYQWGRLRNPGILEVRKEYRGRGIGKILVDYRIKEAREEDKVLLRIRCIPETSIPFWKRMGFQLLNNEKNDAFMLIETSHDLPSDGFDCKAEICFSCEENDFEKDLSKVKTFKPGAVKAAEGYVYLSERVAYFNPIERDSKYIIKISVDGRQVYFGRARNVEAQKLGVKSDGYAVYLDKIVL